MRTLLQVAGQLVEFKLTTDAGDVEDSFPITVPVPVPPGERWETGVTGVLVAKCDGSGSEAVQVREWSWADDVLTIANITGLDPATDYTIGIICLSLAKGT